MHVLIAEDDPVSRRILQDAVSGAGHEVTLVGDGREAWRRIEAEHFDLVISDWVMPEMDGLELCRRLRARADAPFCHVMLLTSRNSTEDIVTGIMAGANDFVTKPFDRAVLIARLHAAERVIDLERSLAARVTQLEEALHEVATLRRLLPICTYCKSIRNDEQAWNDIEEYFHKHAQTDFTHSICPTCYEGRIRPMLDDLKRDRGLG
jgi:sigma-B regulation protein RsbU (phosphoserine phosphatase)